MPSGAQRHGSYLNTALGYGWEKEMLGKLLRSAMSSI